MAVFPAFFGLLMAALVTGQGVHIEPQRAVRRAGDELQVLCKVPYPIDSCRMTVGTTPYRLRPGDAEGDVVYFGEGLDKGECGAHVRHIREEWNGNISCVLPPERGAIELTATMQLMVAKAPSGPQLVTPPQPTFKEGDVLAAQCVVPGGRPAAKITWFLDGEELLKGVHQPVVAAEAGSDLQTVSQNVTRTLSAADGGRTLLCRAEHEAWPQPREAKRQLIVYYPPKVESKVQTIFGLQVNAEARLNVSVRANPAPRAEWSAGDARLLAPQRSDDGALTALQPLHLGDGLYNVTLVLAQIKKEDVERTLYLTVSNELGAETLSLRVSTMDEPAARKAKSSYLIIDVYGVELDTGAIVGIVIAVLVVLLAISLVVFAFATDRWCFAGGRRGASAAKSSGESDTESAAGGAARGAGGAGRGAARLAALGARVRAALPRVRRDGVQPPPQHHQLDDDDDKPAPPAGEEGRAADGGVVYATLALAAHAPPPAHSQPPPAFAEYAEIVYTDQGQKVAKEAA